MAYYEIFHEFLATATQASIAKVTPMSWHSKHPNGAPYFLEYLNLLRKEGGVQDFDPSFSVARFIPETGPNGPISAAEVKYIEGLVDYANSIGRVPVLTDTRTIGRLTGIKAAIPGSHVLIYRNLFQQWCSYSEQASRGNHWFINQADIVIQHATHDPFLLSISNLFPIKETSERDVGTFLRFVLFHIYLYAHSADACDMILNANKIADNSTYRNLTEEFFQERNIDVDFSDAKNAISYCFLDMTDWSGIRNTVEIAESLINSHVHSEKGRSFAAEVVQDLFEEMQRHHFQTKSIYVLLHKSTNDLGHLQADLTALRDTQSLLEAARDEARKAEMGARKECELAAAERDLARSSEHTILQSLQTAVDARDAALDMLAEANNLRDIATAGWTATEAAEKEAAQAKDDLLKKYDELSASFIELSSKLNGTTSELDKKTVALLDAQAENERVRMEFHQLLKWAIAYHDSTAASASWRLTRPLRWVGLGRPVRPGKPDFLL